MTRILMVVAALAWCVACARGDTDRPYPNSEPELFAGFYAKNMCSCRFVLQQTSQFCAAWVRQDPPLTTFLVDEQARSVDAFAPPFVRTARYLDPRHGCTLD